MNDIGTLDRQIAQLQDYKPIPENEVKNLCDKVSSQVEEFWLPSLRRKQESTTQW